MHCLSLIREAIHLNEFDFNDYIDPTKDIVFDYHANHCLFALDTVVRCKADISPVVLEEREETVGGLAGAQLSAWRLRDPIKRCRKFEPLRDWFAEHPICSSYCAAPEIYGFDDEVGHHRHPE